VVVGKAAVGILIVRVPLRVQVGFGFSSVYLHRGGIAVELVRPAVFGRQIITDFIDSVR
jgi:hypothetical protein